MRRADPSGVSPRMRRALTYPLRMGSAEEEWLSSGFGRLALINVLSASGDALVAVALAGSVFVSVPLDAARGRTALGLLCTMLPFAIVAPLTGPATDRIRGGKRTVVVLAAASRMAAALMMGAWLHSMLLFPAAFVSLVSSRTHGVARAALVPAVIDPGGDLVKANARMALGSAVASAVWAGVGAAVYAVLGAGAVLDVDALLFAVTAALALVLLERPLAATVLPRQPSRDERSRPVPAEVVRPAAAMAGIRGVTGFMTALVAFGFRAQGAPVIWYGIVAVGGVLGNLCGAGAAASVRRVVRSQRWIVSISSLAVAVTAAVVAPLRVADHRISALILAVVIGLAAAVAKTAFDAIVQAEISDESRARVFGRLEAVFQGSWVLMALVPTAVSTGLVDGFAVMAVVVGFLGGGLGLTLVAERWRSGS